MKTVVNLYELSARFPSKIADDAKTRRLRDGLRLADRFKYLGVETLLGGGVSGNLRTAEIARECRVPESTLYRHIPKPVAETLVARALVSLEEDFNAPRRGVLFDATMRLATDDGIGFRDAVDTWSEVYGAVANPASVYQAGLSVPHEAGRLIASHADMITRSVKLLGLGKGVPVPSELGLRVLTATAAHDMTEGLAGLGTVTGDIIKSLV